MNITKTFLIFLFLISILSCNKFPDLGGDYKLDYNSRGDVGLLNSDNSYIIYGHILECNFNSTYIILTERPRDSIPECTSISTEMTAKKCNAAFNSSSFKQYWIINKKEKNDYYFDTITNTARYSNVYGPFKKDVYLQKRKELGVPDELRLKVLK